MNLLRLLKGDLAREAARWVSEGIISVSQAEAICSGYGIDYHRRERSGVGYRLLVSLGFLFIGLAIITLVGANWDDIPRAVRAGALVSLVLAANLTGLDRFRRSRRRAAAGWFFLGGLCYGAAIMLIAQIYHLGEHYPDGILWWWVGILPLALLLDSRLLMLEVSVLGFLWFFVETSLDFYPAAFPVLLAALLWQVLHGQRSLVLFLALVAGIGFWLEYTLSWMLQPGPGFDFGTDNILVAGGLFIAYHGAARLMAASAHATRADYGSLLAVWVLRFVVVALILFSFREPWYELLTESWRMPMVTLGLVVAFSLCGMAAAWRAHSGIGSTAVAILLYITTLAALFLTHGQGNADLAFQVVDNIVLVSLGVWLIVRGIRCGISHYFYLGVFCVLVTGCCAMSTW
jgi:uncharacterized membrane protein